MDSIFGQVQVTFRQEWWITAPIVWLTRRGKKQNLTFLKGEQYKMEYNLYKCPNMAKNINFHSFFLKAKIWEKVK
jgi:hypothetical protein